jgi:NodT family efflux transporter outer membrane factor (OMF) lipoprotein
MLVRRIGILSLLLLLAHGCVTVPKHDLAEKMSSAGCEKIASLATDTGFFPKGDFPDETWWEDFDDPQLTHLIEEGLKSSPTLKKAEARLKAAAQSALQTKSRLYPEVDFDGVDNWQHLSKSGLFRAFAPTFPPVINQIDLNLDFFYEFDFWGKNRDLFKAALGEAKAAAAEMSQAKLILTTSIAYSYFQAQYLLLQLDVLDQIMSNKREISKLTEKRVQEALSNELQNINRSNIAINADAKLDEVETTYRVELHKLKALTALGQDAFLDFKLKPLKGASLAVPDNLSLDLLSRRPDLAAQLMRLEAAAKRIDAAKSDFYPNFNLSAFIGLETVINGKLFKKGSFSGSLAPAVHLPIFTAGRLRAQLQEKVALFNEAVHEYDELILKAAQEVADQLTSIAILTKEQEKREKVEAQAWKKTDLAKLRFSHALDNKIQVLEAEDRALQAKLDYATTAYTRQLKSVLLIKSLGGGYNYDK